MADRFHTTKERTVNKFSVEEKCWNKDWSFCVLADTQLGMYVYPGIARVSSVNTALIASQNFVLLTQIYVFNIILPPPLFGHVYHK